jgi:hypothetical protein
VVLHATPVQVRRWRRLLYLALLVVALAVTHEAVFIVRGHDATGIFPTDPAHAYWPAFLVMALVAFAGLAWWARWRLTSGVRSAAANPTTADRPADGTFDQWQRYFARLAPTFAAAFLLLENAEHLMSHGHIEGVGVYTAPGAELALPVLLSVVGAISLLGALVRWREITLIERLRAMRARVAHRRHGPISQAPHWRVTAALVQLELLMARDDHGRAPPQASAI